MFVAICGTTRMHLVRGALTFRFPFSSSMNADAHAHRYSPHSHALACAYIAWAHAIGGRGCHHHRSSSPSLRPRTTDAPTISSIRSVSFCSTQGITRRKCSVIESKQYKAPAVTRGAHAEEADRTQRNTEKKLLLFSIIKMSK